MASFWTAQFLESSGDPYAGAKIYHYVTGTTTDKTAWSDSAETTPVAQPLVADSAGRASMYLSGPYRLLVQDSSDSTIYDYDPVDLENYSTAVVDTSVSASILTETVTGTFPAAYSVVVVPSWVTTATPHTLTTSSFKIAYGTQSPSSGTKSYFIFTA